MTQRKQFVVHVRTDGLSCHLADMAMSSQVNWRGEEFYALIGYAGCYEYLRAEQGNKLIGVELHLPASVYDDILRPLPHVYHTSDSSVDPSRWQVRFTEGTGRIDWEQVVSENPLVGYNGDILLILETDYLSDEEYCQIEKYVDVYRSRPNEAT